MTDRSQEPAPTGESSGERIPVPNYEADQFVPPLERITEIRKGLLVEEFGHIRTYFKANPEKHIKLQRALNQARYGTTYDVYLTRSFKYALAAFVGGTLLGTGIALLLSMLGVVESLSAPISVGEALSGPVAFVSANRLQLVTVSVALLVGGLAAVITWFVRYYQPFYHADVRRRSIDITLPHVIVYMYALSFGGMDFVEVLRRTGGTEATYGAVAVEFDAIVKDVELFGSDLYTALRNARNLTPSDNLEQFLDDMLSVLDSGGDMTTFLRDESEKYMDRANHEQESFLETLETLSEVFIVGFVAAPLFLVVTLLLMSFLGENTLPLLFALVYAVLPLGMIGFVVLIATLSEPYKQPVHDVELEGRGEVPVPEAATEVPLYGTFRSIRRRKRIRAKLSDPFSLFKAHPLLTLLVSVPATLGLLALYPLLGQPVSVDVLYEQPIAAGVALLAVPFLLATTPLVIFHEMTRRHDRHISARLPDVLDVLASANQMGVHLAEGLEMVSRNSTDGFGEELAKTRNDIGWNHDVRGALLSLANRLEVPQVTRTCNILAEGSRSTGDLHKVLSIAAEDTRHRHRLDKNRRQAMNSYTVIVVIGFLVFLGTLVIIDTSFLGAVTDRVGDSAADTQFISINSDTVDTYHAIFFQAALVQAVGTGAITGKLTDNSVRSGLKYSIALVLVAVAVFTFL